MKVILMGNITSSTEKRTLIGRSNVAVSGVYSLYDLEDKTCFYNVKKKKEARIDILLDTKLKNYNIVINKRMLKSPVLTQFCHEKLEYYKNCCEPLDKAMSMLANAKKNECIYYDSLEHKNQIIICKENIFEVSEDIGKLVSLTHIQLCCNYITALPCSLQNLQNLRSLVLYRNQLREVPNEICDLQNLLNLDLSFNFLCQLPETLPKLKLLTNLNIENNCFDEVPMCISNLASLRSLNISNNFFDTIPFHIFKMPFLMDFVCNDLKHSNKQKIKKVNDLTLKEICARRLVKNELDTYDVPDIPLAKYLLRVECCGFCGGPVFESYYCVNATQVWEGAIYPVFYKMCKKHYSDHTSRIRTLFSSSNIDRARVNRNMCGILPTPIDLVNKCRIFGNKTKIRFPENHDNYVKQSFLTELDRLYLA